MWVSIRSTLDRYESPGTWSRSRSLWDNSRTRAREARSSRTVSNGSGARTTLIDALVYDLRHEALSRLADDAVPVHELQMLAGHAKYYDDAALHEGAGELTLGNDAPG